MGCLCALAHNSETLPPTHHSPRASCMCAKLRSSWTMRGRLQIGNADLHTSSVHVHKHRADNCHELQRKHALYVQHFGLSIKFVRGNLWKLRRHTRRATMLLCVQKSQRPADKQFCAEHSVSQDGMEPDSSVRLSCLRCHRSNLSSNLVQQPIRDQLYNQLRRRSCQRRVQNFMQRGVLFTFRLV